MFNAPDYVIGSGRPQLRLSFVIYDPYSHDDITFAVSGYEAWELNPLALAAPLSERTRSILTHRCFVISAKHHVRMSTLEVLSPCIATLCGFSGPDLNWR